MSPHELRATLDRLDLSAAEAGQLLGVHRATIYRWLDGSMPVPIVVELLLRLMVRRGIRPAEVTASRLGQTSAKPQSGRSQAKPAKPIVHNTRARSKQAALPALLSRPRGATIAAMMDRAAPGHQSHGGTAAQYYLKQQGRGSPARACSAQESGASGRYQARTRRACAMRGGLSINLRGSESDEHRCVKNPALRSLHSQIDRA